MESYYCGTNVQYDFCNDNIDDDCTGNNGSSGAGTSMVPHLHERNELTMLILSPYDVSKQGAVMLFKDNNCEGGAGRFLSNENPKYSQ